MTRIVRNAPLPDAAAESIDAPVDDELEDADSSDFARIQTARDRLAPAADAKLQERLSAADGRQLPEKMLSNGVASMLVRRAVRYAETSPFDRRTIEAAARTLMTVLDSRALPADNKLGVACVFPADVAHLLDDARARAFLVRATEALAVAKGGGERVELWKLALKEAGGDARLALRWMATMFQDVDALTHVRMLRHVYPGAPDVERLQQLCEAVRDSKWVKALPDGSDDAFDSRAVYHFYVIAYAVDQMKERGVPPALAGAMACVLNTTYEFFRHNLISGIDRVPVPGIDNGLSVGAIVWGLIKTTWQSFFPSDPKALAPGAKPSNPRLYQDPAVEHRHVLNDSYFGFAGGRFGASITSDSVPPLPDKGEFENAFAADPRAFLSQLFVA